MTTGGGGVLRWLEEQLLRAEDSKSLPELAARMREIVEAQLALNPRWQPEPKIMRILRQLRLHTLISEPTRAKGESIS